MKEVFSEYAEKMDGLLKRGPGDSPEAFRAEVTRLNCETLRKLEGDSDRSLFGLLADCAENVACHPESYGYWADLVGRRMAGIW